MTKQLYLVYFQRMVADKNVIFATLSKYSNEDLNLQNEPGKWTIAQTLEHLRVSEKQILNAVSKYMANTKVFKTPNFVHYLRFYIILSLFRLRIPLKAPKFVADFPEVIDSEVQHKKWLETRVLWIEFLTNLDPTYSDIILMKHPMVGPMNVTMITQFMLEHYYVHKAQVIRKIALIEQQASEHALKN